MTYNHPSGVSKVLHPLRGINGHGSEGRKKKLQKEPSVTRRSNAPFEQNGLDLSQNGYQEWISFLLSCTKESALCVTRSPSQIPYSVILPGL